MIVFLAVAALLVAAIALFMNRPEFGRAPRGERLERIWRSPNYRDGAFRNRHATPQLTSGKGWWHTYFFMSNERKKFVMCISKRRHLYFLSMRINIGTCFSHR
jgi:hypothetical protein